MGAQSRPITMCKTTVESPVVIERPPDTVSTEEAEETFSSRRKHPHGIRRAKILKDHPEIGKLFGANIWSAPLTVVLVVVQMVTAVFFTEHLPWYAWLPLGYCMGAVVDHALWVLIHDFTHNLVFKSITLNRIGLVIANIPHVLPSAMSFRYYHIIHHIELNQADKDPDVPAEWEAQLVGNSRIGKALWLAFFWVSQSLRITGYTYKIPSVKEFAWIVLNAVVVLGAYFVVFHFYGVPACAYLLFASVSSIGLHPLGARWIQEHYPTQPFQSTYSYYGPLNRVAFNIGFHNEHHDFPSVAWNNLPKLREAAPEYYNTLYHYLSYSRLLVDFILNEKWSLQSRIDSEKQNFELSSEPKKQK